MCGTNPSRESTITIRKLLAASTRFVILNDKNVFRKLFPLTFQPMLDYVDTKERQGVFFEKPTEKIHLPEPAELALMDHSKSEFRQSLNFI